MLDVRITAADADAHLLDLPADPNGVRSAAGAWARGLTEADAALDAADLAGARLTALVEGLVLGAYRFSRATEPPVAPTRIDLCGATDTAAVEAGRRRAAAVCWARDLANTRTLVKTPAWLGARADDRLTPLGVRVDVRDEAWLAEHGFGGVLAVGGGAGAPPRLIEASWRPRGAAGEPHVVLVGKGITFDTGGLNRKTGTNMNTMFTDMSGGAVVLGALHATAAARVPVRVTVLVPTAENAFSGAAYRPGDVVRHVGGRTSEITNTDAEGRIVLADALAWALARLRPTALVDVATLTGAAKVALGTRTAALFATDDDLAAQVQAAGERVDEPLWRLPLVGDYAALLHSEVADAVNSPGNPGAITAALFLREFVGEVPWAHLDIAGPGRAAKDDGVLARGATAFGVRLLADWIAALAP